MPSVLGREGPGSCFTATGLLSIGVNITCFSHSVVSDPTEAQLLRRPVGRPSLNKGLSRLASLDEGQMQRRDSHRSNVSQVNLHVYLCFNIKAFLYDYFDTRFGFLMTFFVLC